MYLNGSDTLRTASVVSVREISSGTVCVSLYYYMEHNTTTLTISQKESTSVQTSTIKEIVGSKEMKSAFGVTELADLAATYADPID